MTTLNNRKIACALGHRDRERSSSYILLIGILLQQQSLIGKLTAS